VYIWTKKKRMMKRRTFLQAGSALSLGAMILPAWPALVVNNLQPLRRNTGVYTQRGGTIGWLAGPEGSVIIDTQFPEQALRFSEQLEAQSQAPLRYLINTHHHGDHTGGNSVFRGKAEKVVAHENCLLNHRRQANERGNVEAQLFADTTFRESWSAQVGDERIRARYFGAAHTNGDIVVHFEEANVAHVGDLMFNRRFPYIDKPGGANIASWISVLQTIRQQYDKDTLFIFGHAGEGYNVTGNHADLQAFEGYLSALLDTVSGALKAGKTKEQILAITSIPGAAEWTGEGIQRSLTAAWEELQP
jgi:cyclase